MEIEKTYGGELIVSSPPQISQENQAAEFASFGAANYPQTPIRQQFVGGYGYNTNPYQQNYYNNCNNPYNYFNQPNPAIGLGANPYYYQQYQQPQTNTVFIPPVNFGGEFLPSMNYEEEIEKIKIDFWLREQELAVTMRNNNYNNYYGYNYYGNPYYSSNNSLMIEAQNKINQIKEEARENRKQLNLQLARLAHNYVGHHYNDEDLQERYNGKIIENPYGITMADLSASNRFANLVPFDNSQNYQQFQASVSEDFNKIIPKDADLATFCENAGVLYAQYQMEEEQHRRRQVNHMYNSDGYTYFIRKCIAERKGIINNSENNSNFQNFINNFNPNQAKQDALASMPTLSQCAKLSEDGTLNITCNFGSMKGATYNANENKYDQNRERFNRFLDSIPNSIYNPKGSGG